MKFKKIFSVISLIFALVFGMLTNFSSSAKEDKSVIFYVEETTRYSLAENYLFNNIYGLLASIEYNNLVKSEDYYLGKLISVNGTDNVFFAPIFDSNNNCIVLVKVFCDNLSNSFSISFSDSKIDIFNNLETGKYYLSLGNDCIYLIGNNICELLDGENNTNVLNKSSICTLQKSRDYSEINILSEFLFENHNSNHQNRSIISSSLSVPFVSNGGGGGIYGYCWCSSSAALCKYFGYSSTTADNVHILIHGLSHPLVNCTGGSPNDAYNAIHNITSKTATVCGKNIRNDAANAMSSINIGVPIYSSWGYYDANNVRTGHAMVICGYTFDNSNGAFTYKIMDPNKSTYQYAYSSYSATSVNYLIGSHYYTWESSIYDWQ